MFVNVELDSFGTSGKCVLFTLEYCMLTFFSHVIRRFSIKLTHRSKSTGPTQNATSRAPFFGSLSFGSVPTSPTESATRSRADTLPQRVLGPMNTAPTVWREAN